MASKQLTDLEVKEATAPWVKKIEEDEPLVGFAKAISSTADSIDIGTFAKLVKDQKVFNGGRNKLFEHLRKKGYLMKDNVPYQRYIEQGIFEIVEYKYITPYGEKLNTKSLITGKGQVYLMEKIRKEMQKQWLLKEAN